MKNLKPFDERQIMAPARRATGSFGREPMATHRHIVRKTLTVLLGAVVVACSSSSGPGDTTIVLQVDAVTSPTNQSSSTVSGTSDASATVTVTSPVDTVSETASSTGAFSLEVELEANAFNALVVVAVDPANNRASDTVQVLQDGVAPVISVIQPLADEVTAGQSDFDIAIEFAESGSGIDLATLSITNSRDIGGIYRSDGSFSTAYAAGSDLVPIFSLVDSTIATVVADSLAFRAGASLLSFQISDLAGNTSSLTTRSFEVTADPPRLVVTDASGNPGSSYIPVVVGLASAVTVAGVQFDFLFDTLVVATVDSVTAAGRASGLDSSPFNEIERGRVRVLLFDSGGAAIDPEQGPILEIWLTLTPTAPSGGHTLTLQDVTLSDPAGSTISGLGPFSGTLTVP
jgi:hypothetical protein